MQSFNKAQTFYIDPGIVQNAPMVQVSRVDLYFQAKPARTGNISGIDNPGVTIFITDTQYGIPVISADTPAYARCTYDQIATTSDASQATTFRFNIPVPVVPGRSYAIVIMFDGNEQFQLWTSKIGDFLIDKKTISPGPSGNYIGSYFDYTNTSNNFDANGNISIATTTALSSSWQPLTDTDLTFKVYVCRFFTNGFPISANTNIPPDVQVIHTPVLKDANGTYIYPASDMEFIVYSQADSIKEIFVGGQWAYQNTVSYPGGFANGSTSIKVSVTGNDRVTANTAYPNGTPFVWTDIYPLVTQIGESHFIVLKNSDGVDVRKVISIISNTVIQVDEPVSFVNTAAEFLLTPVGRIDSFNKAAPFGNFQSIMMLANSSANSSLRFVNNAIHDITITAGGTGYKNSDVLYVTGFENVANKVMGGYNGIANLVTNSTGGLTTIYFSNLGCGFVNTANMKFVFTTAANTNPTSNTSTGSGATLVANIGSTILTEHRNNIFAKTRVCNFSISDILPHFDIIAPPGTAYALEVKCNYVQKFDASTYSNTAYYVSDNPEEFTIQSDVLERTLFTQGDVPVFMSRSNEFVIGYQNGSPNDRVQTGPTSNTFVLEINNTSNNDFMCVVVNSVPTVTVGSYIINNDYSGENTDQGNAWARAVESQINFGRPAEDLVVYLTAYKPANTDLKVYARMYNSSDSDAFEDKDWTLLSPQYAANLVSSLANPHDWLELTYSPQPYPNTDFTSTGIVTMANNSNVLTGANTAFDVNFQSGDLVVVTNTLFANQYFVDVVNTVTNSTSMTINNPVSNVTFTSSPMKILRVRNYKHQQFDNLQNNNISRYYNSQMVPFDTYDTVAIKVIMLSDRSNLVPRIDDVRAIGVSA